MRARLGVARPRSVKREALRFVRRLGAERKPEQSRSDPGALPIRSSAETARPAPTDAPRVRAARPAIVDAAPPGRGGGAGGMASPALTVVLVSVGAADAALARLVQEAAPAEALAACPGPVEALSAAKLGEAYGREPGLFVFDGRGRPPVELAAALKRVEQAHPAAELVVAVDMRAGDTLAACVQVVSGPGRLTFLPCPLEPAAAREALRAVVNRRRAAVESALASARASRMESGLNLQVAELKARLDIAKHAARHDGLTGALNRTGFVEELTARLGRGRQDQTVVMFDLDRFKAVNDTLGHSAGDDLVRKIATGVQAVLPAGAVFSRLGGDEFGVVVEAATDAGVLQMVDSILKVANQTRYILGHEVQVSASVGVARQGGGASEMEMMRQADLALYAAKREGRNRARTFDTALDTATRYRLSIENGLERALRSGQLRLAYQPIVDAVSAEIRGFEALIRWDSPDHGVISPSEFIPVAEETGLILDVGDWITRQALRDCRKWGSPYVSINLSSRQFLRHNVGERILRYAAEADVPASKVQIELTETAIIDDVERADFNLKMLREAGVRVALDDFGTGYSSLTYLKQFAIDCIKIDKSFVDNVTRDRQSAVIVASVSRLATSLGMSVVAEGVETEDQRRILIAAGCGSLQGYRFGRPMSVAEAVALEAGQAAG